MSNFASIFTSIDVKDEFISGEDMAAVEWRGGILILGS